MKKFKKFDLVYENALKELLSEENAVDSHMFSNGLKIGTCFRLKPSFFTKSEAVQVLLPKQIIAIKELNDREYEKCRHYFKIKTDAREMAGPNVKGANDINSAYQEYGVISAAPEYKDDPLFKFMIPSIDLKHVEVIEWPNNLPPLLSPKNPYSEHNPEVGLPKQVNDKDFQGLGNSPTNRSLPVQNTKL